MKQIAVLGSIMAVSLLSCSKEKAGEVRIVNSSDSTIVLRHIDPSSYQTKFLEKDEILNRLANGQNCIEYYKDYTFSVQNGTIISKDWKHANNWSEYSENAGTKDECTVCEFRIENEDL